MLNRLLTPFERGRWRWWRRPASDHGTGLQRGRRARRARLSGAENGLTGRDDRGGEDLDLTGRAWIESNGMGRYRLSRRKRLSGGGCNSAGYAAHHVGDFGDVVAAVE